MKRLIAIAILALMSSLALALPAPKEIEAAVNAGQLTRAEEMLKEVIREKPNSAKAHYELGQVLARAGRNFEAREALEKAKSLDPSLKFASSPAHFNEILNRIPGGITSAGSGVSPVLASPRADVSVQPMSPVRAPAAPAFPWSYVLIGGGALLAAWIFMRRRAASGIGSPTMAAAGGSMAAAPAGVGSGYGGAYPPAQSSPGAGIGGAVLGGVAGLAAGYGLAKMMEHGEGHTPSGGTSSGGSAYAPIEPMTQPDYGSFDAGAGNDWDAADAGSDDDSW